MIKNKIIEIVVEPNIVYKNDKIKIKVKCKRNIKVSEIKNCTVNDLRKYKVKDLRGDIKI